MNDVSLTVVITTFNRAHLVGVAIESVAANLPNANIVVVDDCSSDKSSEYIRETFADLIKSQVLKLITLDVNVGVTGAKNQGFNFSTDDWVIFLDSDDKLVWESGEKIIKELASCLSCPVIFFRCQYSDGSFVGAKQGVRQEITLEDYINHTSYGEALTAVNKKLGIKNPYPSFLRGYEGLGCARLIANYGNALLSDVTARVYVTDNEDRLSVSSGFVKRMNLIAKGHIIMLREFGEYFSLKNKMAMILKSGIYMAVHWLYQLKVRYKK